MSERGGRRNAVVRLAGDGAPQKTEDGELVSESGSQKYPIDDTGIPLFARAFCSEEARAQQMHYDRIATAYLRNLAYTHTQEYNKYLDRIFLETLPDGPLGTVAEVCCGRGEALVTVRKKEIGVDVSLLMLRAARQECPQNRFNFVQGDATRLPLSDASFDYVVMLGRVHHVNERVALFSVIFRVLEPGGSFC